MDTSSVSFEALFLFTNMLISLITLIVLILNNCRKKTAQAERRAVYSKLTIFELNRLSG